MSRIWKPYPPYFFGAYCKFFLEHLRIFLLFLGYFEWFSCFFLYKENFQTKQIPYLPTLKNIETFPETIHLFFFWPKDPTFVHADSEDWSDWAAAQADLSLCWANSHIISFVMRWLNYFSRLFFLDFYGSQRNLCNWLLQIIRIFNGCEVRIENSVTRVTVRHHDACRVMPNSYSEWRNFEFSIRTEQPL